MKKILVCMLVCLFCAGVQAQKTAKIKATAVGYTGKVIDFEFMDNTANNQQFPFKDNQLMEFEVERAGTDEGKRLALDDCMSRRRD